MADLTVALSARARAQIAADAAALAAAPATLTYSARESAAETAAWNGARLIECRCRGDSGWGSRSAVVKVAVEADLWLLPDVAVAATARAIFDPTRLRR